MGKNAIRRTGEAGSNSKMAARIFAISVEPTVNGSYGCVKTGVPLEAFSSWLIYKGV